MSAAVPTMFLAAVCGGVAAAFAAMSLHESRARKRRREAAMASSSRSARIIAPATGSRGVALRYAEALTRRMFTGATEPLSPCVRGKRASKTRAGARYKDRSQAAGCSRDVTISAYCEARARLTLVGLLLGALAGAPFSVELTVLLALAGAIGGRTAVMRDVEAVRRVRAAEAGRHLSEMLEVVSLGLRSGLTFDRSFALYGSHFESEFAKSCAMAHRRWSLGFATREESLRELAASYDCDELARVIDNIVRSLRFGTPLAGVLEEAASRSRATYRADLEERVAKAPVKMMLPTGTLILPAMLLMVLGPVFLELAQGF